MHGIFDEEEASRMRDEDDPMSIEKRRAQAAFAEARMRAQEAFTSRTLGVTGAIGVLSDEAAAETLPRAIPSYTEDAIAKIEQAIEEELEKLVNVFEAKAQCPSGCTCQGAGQLGMLGFSESPCQELLEVVPETTRVTVAADTGAVRNVINPKDLPRGVQANGVITTHFVGASDEHIENYGEADTVLTGGGMENPVSCNWCVANVSRALHSISETTGPFDGPGTHDVLFNNRLGVVMPPGIVNLILKKIKPLLQYDRRGGLYCAEIEVSGFTRQGQGR